jgi:acetyl-CoA carboxylase biotin carboxyl carrier protein
MVADEESPNPGPFDVPTIRSLVELMSRHDLSEINLRQGDQRICLRRGVAVPLPPPAPAPAAAPTVAAPAPAAAAPTEADRPTRTFHLIKSPTPGTFYARPKPELEPFVKVGSRVTPTTVVCVIEAMKIYNEIQAECNGIITEVVAENGQPVEFGQVLFKVDPTT